MSSDLQLPETTPSPETLSAQRVSAVRAILAGRLLVVPAMRVALPVWNGRVSPVFDVAETICLFTVSDGAVTGRSEHRLDDLGRAATLAHLGVDLLICSAISRSLEAVLWVAGIEVVPEVCGSIEEVIDGYLRGALSDQRFLTPAGYLSSGRRLPARSRRRPGLETGRSRRSHRRSDRDVDHSKPSPAGTGPPNVQPRSTGTTDGRASRYQARHHNGGDMRYVFGPVPSRRLGRSLGVDPVPTKTCDFSCVYCQLGRTRPLVLERQEYLPAEKIIAEVQERIAECEPGTIDWITFVGSGETTLHSRLGWMITRVKDMTSLPVAVITNGSLLWQAELSSELGLADAVLPSLDAADAILFDRINRPHRSITLERYVEGLVTFRRSFRGKLWLETMLVAGLNDGERALCDLAEALRHIQPDEVQINVPTRPPTESWVGPPDDAALQHAASILGGVAPVSLARSDGFRLELGDDLIRSVASIVARHPLREDELLEALERWDPGRALEALAEIAASPRVKTVERLGSRFWCAADASFPDDQC
jgi:wyosine [tRNA(Phe)-imidazoG37] synthetase (radical SAM superfamily)/predicted Fe-Mo cluster-binding NifX family protein